MKSKRVYLAALVIAVYGVLGAMGVASQPELCADIVTTPEIRFHASGDGQSLAPSWDALLPGSLK